MRLVIVVVSGFLIVQSSLVSAQSTLPDNPAATPRVYKVGGDITPPKLLYAVEPEHTEEAKALRVCEQLKASVGKAKRVVPLGGLEAREAVRFARLPRLEETFVVLVKAVQGCL